MSEDKMPAFIPAIAGHPPTDSERQAQGAIYPSDLTFARTGPADGRIVAFSETITKEEPPTMKKPADKVAPPKAKADLSKESTRRLSVDIPFSLHKAVKAGAVEEERDIRDVVIETLTEYANRRKKK